MKLVQYVDSVGIEGTWILLASLRDLDQYATYLADAVTQGISKYLKSNIPPNRFDHYQMGDPFANAMWAGAIVTVKASSTPKNPITEIDSLMQRSLFAMRKEILNGSQVMLNEKGGYHFLLPEHDYVVVSDFSFGDDATKYVVIHEGSEYINLENDPELEDYTINWLGDPSKDFSYVLNLRKFDRTQLTKILKDFVSGGGTTVSQYTTGSDIVQMEQYVDAAIEAGITKIEFIFNAGLNDDIQTFLDGIDVSKITLKYKEEMEGWWRRHQ